MIDKIISESINEYLNKEFNLNTQQLVEMSRINTNEKNIFPYDKYEIKIWSNDHEPPHFHIISDGWNISFLIENGNLYKIKQEGVNKKTYKYIVTNVNNWLDSQCAILPIITNRQNAMSMWVQIHQ